MKTFLLSVILLFVFCRAHCQYSKEAQASQDALAGTKSWISPPFPMKGSKILYTGTVAVPELSQDDLFQNALEWYNYNYKTADTRLEIENPETGIIEGTGVIKYTPTAAGVSDESPIFFSFNLTVADGGYKYEIYNIYGIDRTGRFNYADMYREDRTINSQIKPRWDKRYRYEMLSDANTLIEMMIAHLKQAMGRKDNLVTN